ncbi:MAG TPA: DUF4253 domain-containing protein [Candidatus Obscuribacter sp.]|nr:DUF4253 domain-containing protein [Candidatus Obscuribacter sp.]
MKRYWLKVSVTLLMAAGSLTGSAQAYGSDANRRTDKPNAATSINKNTTTKEDKSGAKTMTLSQEEKRLAAQLGFDESVLELIKKTLNPVMGIIKKGGLEEPEDSFLKKEQDNDQAKPLPEDIENYRQIAASFPELKPLLDSIIRPPSKKTMTEDIEEARKQASQKYKAELGEEKYSRAQKFQEAIKPYIALIQQEAQDENQEFLRNGGRIIRRFNPAIIESEEALNSEIARLKAHFAGKELREENKGKYFLAIKYKGNGGGNFSPDPRFEKLQGILEELGYRIQPLGSESESRTFKKKEDALAFLKDSGTGEDCLSLQEQKGRTFEAIYPIDKTRDGKTKEERRILVLQNSSYLASTPLDKLDKMGEELVRSWECSQTMPFFGPELHIEPGSTVKKIGERRWLIETPARYTAKAQTKVASIAKIPAASAGFELVRNAGTCSDSLGTEAIIDKLKYWDKKYGLTVLEAGRDRMTIRLKNIPDDLSEFCTEYFLFDPECELSENEIESAASLRDIARRIRETKKVSFWWD